MTADTKKRKENTFEKMIKCCIFDLDGTLLNTLGTITHYINKTLAEFGHSAITEADCRRFVGNGPELLIRRSLAHVGVSDENEVQRVLLRYKDNYATEPLYLTEAYNGIPELLLRLKDAGIYTAVLSNKQDDATALTARHFFGDNLDIARGSREGVALKPAPDAIFEILQELGVRADETVYVGDMGVDMKTGKAFGAAVTVGVLWGVADDEKLRSEGADVTVSTADEIWEIVKRCGKKV